ncbi:GNAT family N-acetyltransferase [Hymenobacter cellulosivorans]|uniref:GNAT family N-acetyltransferase n=1 Tax=Hymenobacter cellulosivorans TaxID=2932249 RepID=A0ABY4FES4_9BACT|nr:GNAT family N-acetyltransferase [Hymenobacter cellulosivorans]UOQ55180.1 GNAT family N-acetyltransferase [Hymenobacter cellulosivorans]
MNTTVTMNPALEILPWDTDFLGFPVAQLCPVASSLGSITEALEQARRQNIRLLYWFVDPSDAEAVVTAQGLGARLVDRKVTYSMPVATGAEPWAEGIEPISEVTPQLRSLALQSGYYSRFRTDPGFAPKVYKQLYTRWIESSVAGSMAREVLVYRPAPATREVGLLTLGVHNGCARIGLLSVEEMARGQAIGTKLIMAAQHRAAEWGLSTIQVVTQQENTKACRFYERCGFRPEQVQHIYHIWME